MPDIGVFSRYKGFNDFQGEAAKTNLAQALQIAQIQARQQQAQSGGQLPAALQLANEYQKRKAAGDDDGANLIMQFAKTADKGLTIDANGNYTQMPGYAPAVAGIEGAKAGAKQNAQNISDTVYKPRIAGGEAAARLNQQLIYEPEIESAKKLAESRTGVKIADDISAPILDRMILLNNKTIDCNFQ